MAAEQTTLLLVDDEESLLRLMQTYLKRFGYSVESAANTSRALTLFDEAPDRFQLVVADITLPDGSGEDMAIQMAQRNPNLRVLICSGYPHSLEAIPADLHSRFDVLQKPFLPAVLAQSVEGLLRRKVTKAKA
jgi:DNA-binding NtrC family response regulator